MMTNSELFDLLDFEQDLVGVDILAQHNLPYDATFIRANLIYPNFTMTIPFVYFANQDWIFTPCDWQGFLPESTDDLDKITWRVNDTDTEGVMFNGVPMLAPWTEEIRDDNRQTRKRIGSKLKERRTELGLSLRTLEERSGIHRNIICRIEGGRANTTIDTINALAMELGLTLNLD